MKSYFGENTESIKDNQCFMIMPFSEPWSYTIYNTSKKVIERNGMTSIRGDEVYGADVLEDIWISIKESRIIITDITGKNSNVLYELGLAHAYEKDVIILSQDEKYIPFDIKTRRCIIYDNDKQGLDHLESELSYFINRILSKDLKDNFGEKIKDDDYVVLYVSAGGTCRCAMANSITRYHLKNRDQSSSIRTLSVALMGATDDYASFNAQETIESNLKN